MKKSMLAFLTVFLISSAAAGSSDIIYSNDTVNTSNFTDLDQQYQNYQNFSDCRESDYCRVESSTTENGLPQTTIVTSFIWENYALALQILVVVFLGFIELNKEYFFGNFFEKDLYNRILKICSAVAFLAAVMTLGIVHFNLETIDQFQAGVR